MKGSQHGYILHSDMTVSSTVQSGKTPIGVVVCSYAGGGGQAMAVKSLGKMEWGGYGYSISGILTTKDASYAASDISSCSNTAKIRAAGGSSTYPAAWAVYNYTTAGTNVGDWCLPAAGVVQYIYEQKATIDNSLRKINGDTTLWNTQIWSSTASSSHEAWNGYWVSPYLQSYPKTDYKCVYPVFEF